MRYIFLIILSLTTLIKSNAQNDTCLHNTVLGISFPPVGTDEQRSFSKTRLDDLGIKKIRFAEDWAQREPTPGEFNWQPLDARINWATDNGYEILLTIQSHGSDSACSSKQNDISCVFRDNNEFKNYIELLLQRYPGRISKIQFGNEWQSDYWYVGNAGEFIQANNVLYDAVKTYSPATQVVLGGFTTISLRFLAGCSGYVDSFYNGEGVFFDSAYLADNCTSDAFLKSKNRIDSVLQYARYDMLDLHLYDDVEQWDEYYQCFADTITKPIIISEFGGPNMNYEPYSDAYQANRLYQYIRKLDSLRIPEAYYFKLVEGTDNPAHANSGLIDDTTLQEKPAYDLFRSFTTCPTFSPAQAYGPGRQIRFYPNPMQDHTTFEFKNMGHGHSKTITIYNSSGQMVRSIEDLPANHYLFKRGNLPPGFYFVKVKDKTGPVATGKLIIDR